jgi:putative ABC transport system permease protein
VFARLKRAPEALADRLADIPGVARVQTRVVVDVTLDVPGLAEPATGRLISVPDRPTPGLNELHLRRGRLVEPGRRGEVLVNEAFADAHHLGPGDSLRAVINGRHQKLSIVGVALSPEYVYPIREGEIIPDNRRYGVFWMGREELAAAYDMKGAFNDLTLALMPGAVEVEVLRQVDTLIAPYGGLGAFGRSEQTSNQFVSNEIAQLRSTALIAPSIFLGIAAFLLHMAVTRMVGAQREQIAMLKAFGYSRWEVGAHYLGLVAVLVVAGLALGTAVGAYLGYDNTQVYTQFFHFPAFNYRLDAAVVWKALFVSAGAALAGTVGAIARAARLPPAEAMRPEPPARYRPVGVEALVGRWLSPVARMTLRNLARRPVRSALTGLGLALAVSGVVVGNFIEDSVNAVIDFQFFATQSMDVTVGFVQPAPARVLSALRHLPGVRAVEPFRSVPVRMRHENHSRRLALQGRRPDATLSRPRDAITGRPVEVPPEGVVLSAKLAEVLDVAPGGLVTVEVLEGERLVRSLPVAGVYHDYAEPSALIHIGALERLLRQGDAYSGAHLAVEPGYVDELYKQLKQAPKVAGVMIKDLALKNFNETLAENLLRMKAINLVFAAVIAFGVVYNSARIALAERSRDLATLRVLGFTRGEIAAILLGELAVLTAAAVPVGLGLGFGMVWLAATYLDTETQRFPAVVSLATCAFAVALTLAAAVLSGLVVRRGLVKLDLIAVLKARE